MVIASGCGDATPELDEDEVIAGIAGEDGKPSLELSGWEGEGGKEDSAAGRQGLPTSVEGTSTQVWEVRNQWGDRETEAARAAGIAWPANSGLSWEQKYRRWISSFKRVERAGSYGETFEMMTPWGHTVPAPSLECAEVSMFLRITFASWYNLPFYMEAVDGNRQRVYFGHFGVRTAEGRYGRTAEYKALYRDHSALADAIRRGEREWPSDAQLASRKIPGSYDDKQPAIGPDAHAGAYFDRVFLNKRVGYYLMLHLTYFGSVSMADPANTYNVRPEAVSAGDSLVERWQRTGIGHVHVVMRSRELGTREVAGEQLVQREVELASGSMPRRQPVWETPASSKRSLTAARTGGEGYVDFGGGLKRWRTAIRVNGRWANAVLAEDRDSFMTAVNKRALEQRPATFERILAELSLDQKVGALVEAIEGRRNHLRQYPASCSARIKREELFDDLYALLEDQGWDREAIDAEHRLREDYVLAELDYAKSKTCCWNSTNAQMYALIMEADAAHQREAGEAMECREALVFKNRRDAGDGYEVFRRYAESVGRGAEWRAWRADEGCPQSNIPEATEVQHRWTPLCL
jgi:hypothetical protein